MGVADQLSPGSSDQPGRQVRRPQTSEPATGPGSGQLPAKLLVPALAGFELGASPSNALGRLAIDVDGLVLLVRLAGQGTE